MSIYSFNTEFIESGLDSLIELSNSDQFEKSYLLESEKYHILNMLSEKTHLLEYDNLDFQENINYIISSLFRNKYATNHFSKDELYAIDWLESLDIELLYQTNKPRIEGKALISKSKFDFNNKIIKHGIILLVLPNNAGMPAMRSAVLHELKHLFTTLIENRIVEKDIELRNKFVTDKRKMYIPFSQIPIKDWDLENLKPYEYEYVQNTLLEFCYYVNENEIRSKLENVAALFRRRVEGLKTNVYMKFYWHKQENKCLEQLYLNIDVIATYKKAKHFCKDIKKNKLFMEHLNTHILDEVNKTYDKKWDDSTEWMEYLVKRFFDFGKRSADVACLVISDVDKIISKYLKEIKHIFYNQISHKYEQYISYQGKLVDYKTLANIKLSPFTYIEDLVKYINS